MIPLESILKPEPPAIRDPGSNQRLQRVRYSHEAMIDVLIAEPATTQRELAAMFDRTEGWISIVLNSDVFQARLAERRELEVIPHVTASIKTRINAIASESLQRIHERLLDQAKPPKDEFLLATAKLATDALGYGARPAGGSGASPVQVVVNVPQQVPDARTWQERYATPPADVVEPPALP